ncbi:MAG: cytochrome ubiquinol oxidase subunit I [Candidatus Eremiobacteraeota bacterium]|nr:cytochrome ubiquinol oxidase subunit I [Candidatus Eremiobacteraeota bacterium]
MEHVLAARAQMGTSLAFHFIFSALGIGLPLLLVIVEGLYLKTGDRTYYILARTWAKAMAALFIIGAVSGTTISFELGLLWPVFMQYAGGIIGIPFSAEGFAFFVEAIFVGIYLYGWDRLSPRNHWLCSIPIAVSGALSGFFVTCANAWMNAPAGFRVDHGRVVDVQPLVAMFNPAWPTEVTHTILSAYIFVGFGVAAVYAFKRLRGDTFATLQAIRIALMVGATAIPIQMVVGDLSARFDAHAEPAKLAALEGQFKTQAGAPLRIGGIPDETARTTRYAIEIPKGLSFLAFEDASAVVRGVDSFAKDRRPPVLVVHLSFQTMVGSATLLLLLAGWWTILQIRRTPYSRMFLRALVASGFLAFLAMEAGWMVTEEGRQPWIVQGFWLTRDAVTPVTGLGVAFAGFTVLYLFLSITLGWLLLTIDRGMERHV